MKRVRTTAAVTLLLWLACCGYSDRVAVVSRAVDDFHEKYNVRDFAVLWRMADGETLRRHISERDSNELLKELFNEVGPVLSTVQTSSRAYYGFRKDRVRVEYNTTFQHGSRSERFLFALRDGKVALMAYDVRKRE